MRQLSKILRILLLFFFFLFLFSQPSLGSPGDPCSCQYWDTPSPPHCEHNSAIPPYCDSGETCDCPPPSGNLCSDGTCMGPEEPTPTPLPTLIPCISIWDPCGASRSDGRTDCCDSPSVWCGPNGIGGYWCTNTIDITPPITPPPGGGGPIQTALGPIDVGSPTGFVETILRLAIGIGGGIAILLIIYGAFLVLTSSGNPEKVQAGKELISSAIIGLLVIIFAVFIMEMIGVKILEIFP